MLSMAAVFLVVVALLFAWSMGAHYTGAVMGMSFASNAIRMWPALVLMAILTIIGATFASEGVQQTVGLQIVNPEKCDDCRGRGDGLERGDPNDDLYLL